VAILGTSFQIGRSALAAYQAAISVAGQNIANVGNPEYTRQSARLAAMHASRDTGGIAPGAGVQLAQLQRHFDAAVESRLRDATSERSAAELQYRYLSQVESLYNELSDGDLSTQLSELFAAFGSLQTTPEDTGRRSTVIASAESVIRNMQRQRSGLVAQLRQMNNEAASAANRVSAITTEVARLNQDIVQHESDGRSSASALRDRRDGLLRELSEIVNVNVRYQENGVANVYVGSTPLVEFNRARGLTVDRVYQDGLELATVRFTDDGSTADVRGGSLAAIVGTADSEVVQQLRAIDELAHGLIYEVNRVHSTGAGLVGLRETTASYDVRDTAAALDSAEAGLAFPIRNGSFIVSVRDTYTGQVTTRQIKVTLDGTAGGTSLNQLSAALDGVPGLSAALGGDGRLSLKADADTEFWFSEDSSGALAALGVGTFFTGQSAADINVRGEVRGDPRLIAASLSGAAGDGGNAGRLAVLGQQSSGVLGTQSINDFRAGMVNALAVSTASALNTYSAADTVHASLTAQREAVAGVSLDEEALNLTVFERSFQGASRFLNVINNLSSELLSLVQ
jgi:flagellar hook-associated protein 1 FlgK